MYGQLTSTYEAGASSPTPLPVALLGDAGAASPRTSLLTPPVSFRLNLPDRPYFPLVPASLALSDPSNHALRLAGRVLEVRRDLATIRASALSSRFALRAFFFASLSLFVARRFFLGPLQLLTPVFWHAPPPAPSLPPRVGCRRRLRSCTAEALFEPRRLPRPAPVARAATPARQRIQATRELPPLLVECFISACYHILPFSCRSTQPFRTPQTTLASTSGRAHRRPVLDLPDRLSRCFPDHGQRRCRRSFVRELTLMTPQPQTKGRV